MLDFHLKKLVAAGMIGCSFAIFTPVPVFAAPVSTVDTENDSGIDAVAFKERIDKILYDWEHSKDKFDYNPHEGGGVVVSDVPSSATAVASDAAEGYDADVTTIDASINSVPANDYYEETYTFDWQGTPLPQTLYAISKMSGKRVVVNGKLDGTVYTTLPSVTYAEALNYLASTFNFNWMEEDDAILISPSDIMKQTRVYQINYADKDKLKDEIASLGIDASSIYANSEYGTITVTGTPYQLEAVRRHIASIDHPVQQCLIIAQLIEINHGKSLNLGMQYTLPTYSHEDDSSGSSGGSGDNSYTSSYSHILDHLVFSVSAQAQKAMSKGNVIARPMILAKNGQKADIYMGDSVPVMEQSSTASTTNITVTYKDVGTKLEVTPQILKDGEVNLTINTEVSNITKWITTGNFTSPQISSRRAETVAHVKSGQSMVIGGLMTVSELDSLSGIPGLMDLPILGKLFSYHTKSHEYAEVFIMITPYIVSDGIDPQALLRAGTEEARHEMYARDKEFKNERR